MKSNESLKVFLRFVEEKHNEVKRDTGNLFTQLVNENKASKISACTKYLESAENLSRSLAETDKPKWLLQIIHWCQWYLKNKDSQNANNVLFEKLSPITNDIKNHEWSFENQTDNIEFNFDHIYERFKEDSKLPDLFESLIDTLNKMIESGEIDSLKALESLKQLISLLKQNKTGSYFSVMASWEFIGGFIKNTLWASLDDVPVIKQLKKGFEETVAEMDIELDMIHTEIAKEMKSKYNTTVNSLTYKKQSENLLEYKQDDK